jgi:8-oxo-dGTP diphosphatase
MHSAIAIFYRDNQVLSIGRRNDHDDLGFPGGKLNEGETPLAAVMREVREETGVEVDECVPIMDAPPGISDDWSMERLYDERHTRLTRAYLVTRWRGEPQSLEGMPVNWVTATRMLSSRNSFSEYNRIAFRMAGVQ